MIIRISPFLLLLIALILIIHATAQSAAGLSGGGNTCVSVGGKQIHCGHDFELTFDRQGHPVILHPGDPGYYKSP